MRAIDFRGFGFTIDFPPAFTRQLVDFLLEDGYLDVMNLNLQPRTFEEMIWFASRIFAPWFEPKLLGEMLGAQFDGQRGYGPLATEAYDGGNPEVKRMFTIGNFIGDHPLYGQAYPQWWPLDGESRERCSATFLVMSDVAFKVLMAVCQDLGIPFHEFYQLNREGDDSILRFIEYPEVPESTDVVMRANEHHDSGYLTVTWATGPGLFIQKPDGTWEDGRVDEGHLVLTVGLAFQKRLAYLATKYPSVRARLGERLITARRHKVVAVPGNRGLRHAFALFFWPHPNQEIEPGLSAARHLYQEMSRHMQTVAVTVSNRVHLFQEFQASEPVFLCSFVVSICH